ncbi:hypothetical protein AWR27_11470 [Spirosoma montaniterrae]|uniref:Carbohydrate-binding protein SusD n=2 Tax=Spirosoma montaniterrae TaxID=1178516 RepID=A0A1P9WX41_9BACT|nr:hypothetical protein AWR27_11470 [Spirosoma montaniterrae]
MLRRAAMVSALLLTSSVFTECSEKALDIDNPNQLSPTLFWRNADDAEKALVATYGPLTTIMGWGRMMGAILTTLRGDDLNPFPAQEVNDVGTFAVASTDNRVLEGWGELNAIVARANQVIANVPAIQMNEARKKEILGEAYFLRAFAHFHLLNMWGNIPLITKPVNALEDILVPQAPAADVWASIKSDLRQAQSSLPAEPKDVGRATAGAATALLGKAHLYTKDWAAAATEFKKIVDGTQYRLVANYQDNFQAATNNNAESIFELQYQRSDTGNWGPSGTPNPWRGQAWEPDVAPKGYTSQASTTINRWVYDLFMKEKTITGAIDPRAFATMIWNYPGAKVYQDDFTKAFTGSDQNNVWVRKYLNFDRTSSLTPGSWAYPTNNRRMIRLADVLLMYAEAENEANGPSAAVYAAINRVRARATMPNIAPGLSQAAMREAIRNERVLELTAEGDRIFDLNRWGITADVFTRNPALRSNSGGQFQRNKNELLPIPQNDINTNPQLKQNPGY